MICEANLLRNPERISGMPETKRFLSIRTKRSGVTMIYNNKKALAMNTIIIFILLLALIIVAIFWFTGLGQQARDALAGLANIFG